MKIAIMASGNGSIAQALYEESLKLNIKKPLIITNKEDAFVVKRFQKLNQEVFVISNNEISRQEHEKKVMNLLNSCEIEVVLLAGYMRVLTPLIINKYKNKIINIHPSLLPKYPGTQGYEETYDSKDIFGGHTIHFVTKEVDEGEVILQEKFRVDRSKSLKIFIEEGKKLEIKSYKKVLHKIIQGEVL